MASKFVPKHRTKMADDDKYINIMLLGETGSGKSTFINSFVNYLQYSSLTDAVESSTLTCLIPTKFSITTEDGDSQVVIFNKDTNEDDNLGNSSTQATKAYVFPFEKKMIRVIDTPGINDSRGAISKDRENFENILDFIGQFKHLHAICFLLKPDVTVLTAGFKYCLVELLSRLDRSAATNISFLFTRTCGTNYKAPDTIGCIRRVLAEIEKSENVSIPLRYRNNEQKNCFYFDNEGFKYLVALRQNYQCGNAATCEKSWNVSYDSSWALIKYIMGDEKTAPLPPHMVQDTLSVNEARRLIFELAKPLADITEIVQDNLHVLRRHQEEMVSENCTGEELRAKLYVPVVDLVETALQQPVTICAAAKCAKIYTVSGIKKYHYEQRCHNPCYLHNIQKDLVGDPGLIHCAAMGGTQKCKECKCDFSMHMHVYYETKTIESKIEDLTVQGQLETNAEIIKTQYEYIQKIDQRVKKYREEHKVISSGLAKFAYFLKHNSICPINDAYEAYLDCLIQREKIAFGSNKGLLKRYESLKMEHIEQKRLLEEAGRIANAQKITHVTSEEIITTVEALKKLPLTGKKITDLHNSLLHGKNNELHKNMEYVHPTTAKFPKKQETAVEGTGAKRKNKKGKPDMKENMEKLKELIANGDFEGAFPLLQACVEEQKKQKKEDESSKLQMKLFMDMIQQFTEQKKVDFSVNKGQGVKTQNVAGGKGKGKGNNTAGRSQQWTSQEYRANFNRKQTNPNPGNYQQSSNNPGQKVYYNSSYQAQQAQLQNQHQFTPQNQHNNPQHNKYNAQPPQYYKQPQENYAARPFPLLQQQFYPPQQQFYPPQQQEQFYPPQQQQRPYEPFQLNINLGNQSHDYQQPMQPTPSLIEKYNEPPPTYSASVQPTVRPYNQRYAGKGGATSNIQHHQFKKPTMRKQPQFNTASAPTVTEDKDDDDDDDDDEEKEDEEVAEDGATIVEMKKYLAEKRRNFKEEREETMRRQAQLKREEEAEAAKTGEKAKIEKMMANVMNLFKKL